MLLSVYVQVIWSRILSQPVAANLVVVFVVFVVVEDGSEQLQSTVHT